MDLTLVLFFIFGTLASQAMSCIADKHEQWMANYGRKYENKIEKEKRFNIFKDNLEYIESFNSGGNRSYKLGINEFADMTQDEFLTTDTGYEIQDNPTTSISRPFRYEKFSVVPTSLDWREKGAVTPVKNQRQCAQMAGGWMMNAFEYVMQNQGITTEESYPYQAMQRICDKKKQTDKVANTNCYEMVPANAEEALLKAVMNQPVSVAIDGKGRPFQFYQGNGVFTVDCGTILTHAVTIIGYGTSEEGTNYWLIKNSWGQSWGENGHMKIPKDVGSPGGLCGIAMKPSYPMSFSSNYCNLKIYFSNKFTFKFIF